MLYALKTARQKMMIKFTYCKNFAHAETREVGWESFKTTLTRSVGYGSKKESVKRSAIIGGLRKDESIGRAENINLRTVAMLDYDTLPGGVDIGQVEFMLDIGLDCAFVAYSTFRHEPDRPRFRIAVPLERPVGETQYRQIVKDIADGIGLGSPDDCSYTMNQIMFLPSHKHGIEPWAFTSEGKPWPVADFVEGGVVETEDDGLDDLETIIANDPLELTPDQVQILLTSYPAEGMDYDDWLRVGMAIYHQTEGRGYAIWHDWSALSSKHDPRQMRTKWRSFGGRSNPVTMASIIKAVGGLKGDAVVAAADVVTESLEDAAESVDSRESYNAFKKRVQALNEVQLPPDYRSGLAARVHEAYAKDAGMGLREVKTALKPINKKRAAENDGLDCPDWLQGWVYAEADCVFVNTDVADYAIKREAFRARYDRMSEVVAMETDAATYALNMVKIPTVVRSMYWPGQPKLFSESGKDYVNSYHDSGIASADTIDDDGQSVIDLFLAHVEMLIEDPSEREILLDFMAYIYQSPENRVRWGLLLWGIEGNGKTYFYNVMQLLMGRNATLVNTSMISRPFNDWAVGVRLIGIEEIRISGTNKWMILDQLKPMISNDSIAVEPKGATRYHAPNFASYIMTTNHLDAVPVTDGDRRYCAIFTRHRRPEDLFEDLGGQDRVSAYFDRLFSETERRIDAIGCWLKARKLSDGFNPDGRAPITKGIHEMRQANVSDDRQAVEDAISEHASPIISDRLLDVTHLHSLVVNDAKDMPTGRALGNVLRDKGMRPIDQRRIKIKGALNYVWFVPGRDMTSEKAAQIVRDWHNNGGDFTDAPF